jgi:hypothetical protein
MKKLTIGFIVALALIGVPRTTLAIGLEPVPMPEPATALLLTAGGLGVAVLRRKKQS